MGRFRSVDTQSEAGQIASLWVHASIPPGSKPDDSAVILSWLTNNIAGEWTILYNHWVRRLGDEVQHGFYFERLDDAVLFKMRWLYTC